MAPGMLSVLVWVSCFGGDEELTKARIDCGVIMDQSKMTIMTDESVTNHKG